jgi:ABC-type transporter Mla subunit MlaD
MGAAGKRREDELLAEIANLRRELAERAARIDELKTSLDGLNKTVAQRDSTIAEL